MESLPFIEAARKVASKAGEEGKEALPEEACGRVRCVRDGKGTTIRDLAYGVIVL